MTTRTPPSVVAVTGDRFASFGPYVASVNDAGLVSFQAVLVDGRSCVVLAGEGTTEVVAPPGTLDRVVSHPDIDAAGALSWYGADADGATGVVMHRDGVSAARTEGFASVGPAGPTMNDAGGVAFRGERVEDREGVFVFDEGRVTAIAETGDRWIGFFGLPVIDEDGTVVFRADLDDSRSGIYRWVAGEIEPIVETGDRFDTLGAFPDARGGVVAFAATRGATSGVFLAGADNTIDDVQVGGAFASYRGALLAGTRVVRIATPTKGSLGLFSGPDPSRDRILGIGDDLLGSRVAEVAANPVSASATGHLAIRVALDDGREAIVRTTD